MTLEYKHHTPVIPKRLEENLNPGQIDVELKLTHSNFYMTNSFNELMMSNEYNLKWSAGKKKKNDI